MSETVPGPAIFPDTKGMGDSRLLLAMSSLALAVRSTMHAELNSTATEVTVKFPEGEIRRLSGGEATRN